MKKIPVFYHSGPIMYLFTLEGEDLVSLDYFDYEYNDGKSMAVDLKTIEAVIGKDETGYAMGHGVLKGSELKDAGLLEAVKKLVVKTMITDKELIED